MRIKNTKIYGAEDSIKRSGYPMTLGELDLNKPVSEKDLKRVDKLMGADVGTGHDNFLKGIIVQFDLLYPEYFSPQLQRYHWIDIISSQSKMHRIMSKQLVQTDFVKPIPEPHLKYLNGLIDAKKFDEVINALPDGYQKWMGISTNFLQLKTIYNQRKNHKLKEWRYFCKWIEGLSIF